MKEVQSLQFNEIYEKTKYAFEHDEVFELLMGEKGYSYQAPMVAASVPTHVEFIFRDGIFPYYKNSDKKAKNKIVNCLKYTINQMILSKDEIVVWWVLTILRSQKDDEEYFKTSPFKIADEFWNDIKTALENNKEKLLSNTSYFGFGCSEGLWNDVRRNHCLLMEDYGISVLEEN